MDCMLVPYSTAILYCQNVQKQTDDLKRTTVMMISAYFADFAFNVVEQFLLYSFARQTIYVCSLSKVDLTARLTLGAYLKIT